MNRPSDPALRKSRLKLLLLLGVFVAPFAVAALLSLTGWQPGVKANGEPILPQRNFAEEPVRIALGDGRDWAWKDSEPRLTLVALAGPNCAQRCFATLTAMTKARLMLNRNQSRLRLLYLGIPPADATQRQAMTNYWTLGRDPQQRLATFAPNAPDTVSAILVESNGIALARYPAGFDASGLFRDMQKVIH